MSTGELDYPTNTKALGQHLRTAFLSGHVIGMTLGATKGWGYAGWYYLVDSKKYKPHWVTEQEIL